MYLFTRSTNLQGPPDEIAGWIGEVTNHVKANSPLDLTCWAAVYGAPVGTFRFNTIVENRAAMAAASAALLSDPGYLSLGSKAREWSAAPPEDTLRQLVSDPPADPQSPPLGAVAVTTTAAVETGKGAEAMAFGVDMATYGSSLTGDSVGFFHHPYGAFGTVSWIGISADMAAADAAEATMMSDAGYHERLAKAGDLFLSGSGHRLLSTRVA